MTKVDAILYEFLVEDSGMPEGEFRLLSEEVKTETVVQIANEILHSIKTKMNDIDTFIIDKTRGEIKQFAELTTIQDVIQKLTSLATEYSENVSPQLPMYLKEITQALYNLNKYSAYYKEAYRSKKTLMIISYQSVILSIISSLSYIVSLVVDFKDSNHLKLKQNVTIEEILPLKSIIDFNKSVNNGNYDTIIKDVSNLREFYVEYNVEQMSTIYEAVDIINLLNNGISSFTKAFDNRNLTGVVFKVLGVVMVILSLRDIFYTLYNSRTKITEKLQGLKTFINTDKLQSLSAVTRFITFNNKNIADSVATSNSAKQEINDENRSIINDVKNAPSEFDATSSYIPEKNNASNTNTNTDDLFTTFNF